MAELATDYGHVENRMFLAAAFLATLSGQVEKSPPCINGDAECAPWERKWGSGRPKVGTIVKRTGEMVPPTELAGLYLGQSIDEASRLFASHGWQLVRTTDRFAAPYAIYNFIGSNSHIFGNAGVCRGRVTSVFIYMETVPSYLAALKRFVGEFGQPNITFQPVATDDDSAVGEDVVYAWKLRGLQLRYPTSNEANDKGALSLTDTKPCR